MELQDTNRAQDLPAATTLTPKTEPKKPAAKEKKAATKKSAEPKTKKSEAKKTAVKKSAEVAPTGVRYAFPESGRIVWLVEGNPCREGTRRRERVERVRKHVGKTVGALLEAGCKPRTLNVCVKQKWARVST